MKLKIQEKANTKNLISSAQDFLDVGADFSYLIKFGGVE